MELKEIISIPGMTGLYKIVANNKGGYIVESINDGKRTLINVNQRIMTLSDISVYTKEGEVPLRAIFKKIADQVKDKLDVDLKGDQQKLRDFFKSVVPDYDEDKVYSSDIKKMLTWFDALKDKIDFSKEEEAEKEETKMTSSSEHEKPVPKFEMHGPKTEHAKASTARTRKKV